MIKIKKLTMLLCLYFLTSCGASNTINDIKTLEQKVLEIPPNFDLKPPIDEKKETLDDILNKQNSSEKTNELEEILGIENDTLEADDNSDSEIIDILISDPEIAVE
ncbi:hypothetical protein N9R78_00700 [Pelagibacteraceae bacterium]|nr:hypothetical protein [Pelagibacteraceae bacterium]